MTLTLIARAEHWPLRTPFRISRGVKDAADVVVVEARDGAHVGAGECVPYARYGESTEGVLAEIAALPQGIAPDSLQLLMHPGAARNAIDCALWDLRAKREARSVASLLGLDESTRVATAVTVSLDTPERMAEAAAKLVGAPLLKVKVNADHPLEAIEAVAAAAPQAALIVDPNESWSFALLAEIELDLSRLNVALIEQPLPQGEDDALEGFVPAVPIGADESAHVSADLERVAARYQAVNIKLDKSGGLTEALAMQRRARELGLKIMVGCMVCTSLSIAPAMLLAQSADFVDLDGPWWLKTDRAEAFAFDVGWMTPLVSGWGKPA